MRKNDPNREKNLKRHRQGSNERKPTNYKRMGWGGEKEKKGVNEGGKNERRHERKDV